MNAGDLGFHTFACFFWHQNETRRDWPRGSTLQQQMHSMTAGELGLDALASERNAADWPEGHDLDTSYVNRRLIEDAGYAGIPPAAVLPEGAAGGCARARRQGLRQGLPARHPQQGTPCDRLLARLHICLTVYISVVRQRRCGSLHEALQLHLHSAQLPGRWCKFASGRQGPGQRCLNNG